MFLSHFDHKMLICIRCQYFIRHSVWGHIRPGRLNRNDSSICSSQYSNKRKRVFPVWKRFLLATDKRSRLLVVPPANPTGRLNAGGVLRINIIPAALQRIVCFGSYSARHRLWGNNKIAFLYMQPSWHFTPVVETDLTSKVLKARLFLRLNS